MHINFASSLISDERLLHCWVMTMFGLCEVGFQRERRIRKRNRNSLTGFPGNEARSQWNQGRRYDFTSARPETKAPRTHGSKRVLKLSSLHTVRPRPSKQLCVLAGPHLDVQQREVRRIEDTRDCRQRVLRGQELARESGTIKSSEKIGSYIFSRAFATLLKLCRLHFL